MKMQDKEFVMSAWEQHKTKLGAEVFYGCPNTYYLVLLDEAGKVTEKLGRVTRNFFKWFNTVSIPCPFINVGTYRVTEKVKTNEDIRKEINNIGKP